MHTSVQQYDYCLEQLKNAAAQRYVRTPVLFALCTYPLQQLFVFILALPVYKPIHLHLYHILVRTKHTYPT